MSAQSGNRALQRIRQRQARRELHIRLQDTIPSHVSPGVAAEQVREVLKHAAKKRWIDADSRR